ncbi:hypothetical protein ACFWJV_26245 [Streptomyces rochei]|uniref:hypothetical protein n=1 Tax=Streptomyces TaxID=1883 RepID=UPI00030DEB4B|nr:MULTISPECIES: hypothetical protein [unclassified Streptomyces]MDI3101113.1 hypothetical protein [Streptomyces sp. AN-3]
MSRRRIRRAWLTTAAAAALAFTGLAVPGHADDLPPDVPRSWIQEPRATEGSPTPSLAQDWTAPGGTASPGDFTLSPGAMNAETTRRVTRLDAVLPKSGVQNLLAGANRDAQPWCPRDPFGTAPDPDLKYCLENDDSVSREWVPQGFTGVSDAKDNELWGEAGNIQLFASYDDWDPGRQDDPDPGGDCTAGELEDNDACNQKGVRVTFVQSRTNPATGSPEVKYRHVLLGWTYVNSADHVSFDGLHASEYPIQNGVHAGGIVWYGNYLYVADTRNGLRVFDMRYIMDLNPDGDASTNDPMGADTDGVKTTADVQDKTKVGRHNNVWYSFGYRYVMPQVAAWRFKATQSNPKGSYACVSTGAPKASYISLDRSTVPDRLIMGEYCRPESGYPSTGRIASYPVADLAGRSADVPAQGWANYLPMTSGGAQGAAAHAGTLYVNQSKGTDEPGNLWRYKWSDGRLVQQGQAVKTARGAEDLYVERGTGRLWSVSEHRPGAASDCTANPDAGDPAGTDYCQRVLYGHKLSWIDSRP